MMQTDVKSYHAKASGQIIGFKSRLKSIVIAPGTVGIRQVVLIDSTVPSHTGTWDRPAGTPGPITTTVVTPTAHELTTGDYVAINFSGSSMRDGVYTVTVVDSTTFTVQSLTTGAASGTCEIFTPDSFILEIDTYSTVTLPILIPGEGILCENGIYCVLGANVTATIYYG